MKFHAIKKSICLLLALQFIPGFADTSADFMYHATAIIDQEKELEVPNAITQLYSSDLFIKNNFYETRIEQLKYDWDNANEILTSSHKNYKKLNENITKKNPTQITFEDYQNVIRLKSEVSKNLLEANNLFKKIENLDIEINSPNFRSMFDNYCTKTSSLINEDAISITPKNNSFKLSTNFSYTNKRTLDALQNDPRVNAVGWLSFSASSIGLIASAVAIKGTGFLAGLSISVLSANSVTISASTAGAAIVLVGAAVITCAVVKLFNMHENHKRKAKAKKEYKILNNAMLEAANFYKENSIKKHTPQLQALAFDICANQPSWELKFRSFETIETLQKKYGEEVQCENGSCKVVKPNYFAFSYDKFHKAIKNYDDIKISVKLNEKNEHLKYILNSIEDLIKITESSLEQSFISNLIGDFYLQTISQENLSRAWAEYHSTINGSIKQNLFNTFIKNINDCPTLHTAFMEIFDQLDFVESEIRDKYLDQLNQNNLLFTSQLSTGVNALKSAYTIRMSKCKSEIPEEDQVAPIIIEF